MMSLFCSVDLHDCILSTVEKSLYITWRFKFGNKSVLPTCDGISDDRTFAQVFAKRFEEAYKENSPKQFDSVQTNSAIAQRPCDYY